MRSATSVFPRQGSEVTAWDLQTDVVIVGFGGAGATAAIAAGTAGAEVVVAECTGGHGGSAAVSAGYLYLGGGTSLQKACGFEDTPENMFRFLMAATGPGPNEDKLRLYCERSVEHFDWIVDLGVPFKAGLFDDPVWEVPTDDGLTWSGGENAYPFNEIADPAPRAHIPQAQDKVSGERSSGWVLMKTLADRALDAGVKTEYNLRAERLVVDDDGAVTGVVFRRFGEEVAIRARRGVVLASGGFAANGEMLARHAPRLIGRVRVGTDADDGLGIRMAQAVGGVVRHMEAAEAGSMVTPALLVQSVMVDPSGQRFINEDTYPGRIGQAALHRYDGQVLVVVDAEGHESLPPADRALNEPAHVCETLSELEAATGLPAGSLQTTVAFYNEHAQRGEDPLFHKRARFLRPLHPPYGVVDLRAHRAMYGIFTLGGLVTSVDGEVEDLDGNVIPGLYAAGRTTSGVPSWGYLSGTSLGDATFFGRRAGAAAARAESR